MVTIKDIARRAGVSFSTVSKALRNSPLVQERTKLHILAIAKEMGYQPNIAARQLVSKRSGAIGVVWPSIERTALSTLITRVNEELEKRDYTTLISMNRFESAMDTFHRFHVDAILVFGDHNNSQTRFASASHQIPVLTYGTAGQSPYATLDVHREKAIVLAVQHLVELGHQRIAYIGNPVTYDPLQSVKIEAFRSEMRKQGLQVNESQIAATQGMEVHDGYISAKQLFAKFAEATAVISGSFDLTRGILRAVHELELSVPYDLSIVSYDNIPQMEALDVPMTVVGVDMHSMAAIIAELLMDMIDDPEQKRTVYLEPELVIRSSTAKI